MLHFVERKLFEGYTEQKVIAPHDYEAKVVEGWELLATMGGSEYHTHYANLPFYTDDQYGTKQQLSVDIPVVTASVWFLIGRKDKDKSLLAKLQAEKKLHQAATTQTDKLKGEVEGLQAQIDSVRELHHFELIDVRSFEGGGVRLAGEVVARLANVSV